MEELLYYTLQLLYGHRTGARTGPSDYRTYCTVKAVNIIFFCFCGAAQRDSFERGVL